MSSAPLVDGSLMAGEAVRVSLVMAMAMLKAMEAFRNLSRLP